MRSDSRAPVRPRFSASAIVSVVSRRGSSWTVVHSNASGQPFYLEDDTGTAAVPRRLLTTLFGAGPLRDIMARTGADLRHRIALLLDEEMRRFADVIAVVGTPDAAASLHLSQATYALEVAR